MRFRVGAGALLVAIICAQAAPASQFEAGARLGVSYQFGTQGNRLGATLDGYGRSNDVDSELRLTLSLYRTFSHMETRVAGRERQLIVGLTQGFGDRPRPGRGHDWSLAANNTQRRHSFSLYSILYRDSYDTSQRVRGIGLSVGDVSVRFENDFDKFTLLGDHGDRFRTIGLEIAYRANERLRYVLGTNMFTGDPEQGAVLPPGPESTGRHGQYAMVREDGTPVTAVDRAIGNAWFGVRGVDVADGSSSLAFLGLNDLQLRVGWSSEAIREVAQNRFHDLIFNPHIPLREDARSRPYFTFGTNHGQTLFP